MNQHQIRIMNFPEPTGDELFVRLAVRAHALGREWSEMAEAAGLDGILFSADRETVQGLIAKAYDRGLVCLDSRDAVERLANTCAKRIAALSDPDAPTTRSRALLLTENEEALRKLVTAIDAALDIEAALRAQCRIRATPK